MDQVTGVVDKGEFIGMEYRKMKKGDRNWSWMILTSQVLDWIFLNRLLD